ncbi:MAG: MDR family MFS transporter [Micromonosporaceae bacterium]
MTPARAGSRTATERVGPGGAAGAAGPIPWQVWRLASVIAFGAFMSGLDTSVVNVGLHTIARDLNAGLSQAQWVANAYLIALGMSLPACGWLGRRFGVGRIWLAALAGFTVTSGLCAIADDVVSLVAFRVLQGLTAGVLIPAGQTVLGQAVGPHRLGRVMASLGVAVTLAPALGPVFGGFIVQVSSWPWLFLINIPLGVLGLYLGWRYVPHDQPQSSPVRLDWSGLVLVSLGVPLLVYGLTAVGERAAPGGPEVLAPIVVGLLALGCFVWRARRTENPILDLSLFGNRRYAAATVTAALTGATMFGSMLLFPHYFQVGRDASVIETGIALIPFGLGTACVLPFTGRLVDRYGGGVVSLYGGVAAVLTTVPFTLVDTDMNQIAVQGLLVVRGMATAVAVVPAGIAAYQAVSPEQLPDATTQVNILQRVGGALGGAVFAVILARRLSDGVDSAFQTTFWWLTAVSVLGVVSAAWLAATQRRETPAPSRETPAQSGGEPVQSDLVG